MGGKAHSGRRVSLEEGTDLAERIFSEWRGPDIATRMAVCGSIRRQRPTVGDVDLVVIPKDERCWAPDDRYCENFSDWLIDTFGLQADEETPAHSGLIDGVQVDVMVTTPEAWGAALMHCTGPWRLNIAQRAVAKRLGFLLNDKGLFMELDEPDGLVCIAGRTEEEVYEALGLPFKKPEDRQ